MSGRRLDYVEAQVLSGLVSDLTCFAYPRPEEFNLEWADGLDNQVVWVLVSLHHRVKELDCRVRGLEARLEGEDET